MTKRPPHWWLTLMLWWPNSLSICRTSGIKTRREQKNNYCNPEVWSITSIRQNGKHTQTTWDRHREGRWSWLNPSFSTEIAAPEQTKPLVQKDYIRYDVYDGFTPQHYTFLNSIRKQCRTKVSENGYSKARRTSPLNRTASYHWLFEEQHYYIL